MALIAVRHLNFTYPGQSGPVLRDLSFSLERGTFAALCGPSGCGKSTLLRLLKPELAPHGDMEGELLFRDQPLSALPPEGSAAAIGFVSQRPERQIVTDKVWHELAFGLESLGRPQEEIRRRTAEAAAFFGLEPLFDQDVSTLSGGQKQLLNLASALVMGPELLILDEPTSMLDPMAAGAFLDNLRRINRELGIAVLLCEHRLENAFHYADRVLVMDVGTLLTEGTPPQVGRFLCETRHPMAAILPAPMEVYSCVPNDLPCPASAAEGRAWLEQFKKTHPLKPLPPSAAPELPDSPVLEAKNLGFAYPGQETLLRGVNLSVHPGELLALVGQNGSGKSTLLRLLTGELKPSAGQVRAAGRITAVPQDPQTLFVRPTLREDLQEVCGGPAQAESAAKLCRVDHLLDRHPYDLSGGEQQRAALAKVLLTAPKILLLDEPTKGLDGGMKKVLAALLRDLTAAGTAVLMVSHDMEFCARYAARCALLADGTASEPEEPRPFFSGNLFYTTAVSRMTRGILPDAVTPEDVILSCGGTPWELPEPKPVPAWTLNPNRGEQPLPPVRRALGWVGGILTGIMSLMVLKLLPQPIPDLGAYGILFLGLALLAASRWEPVPKTQHTAAPLPPATRLALILVLLLIPATVWFGPRLLAFLGDRAFYGVSLLVVLEAIAPFFLVFEGRKPQARELVLLAALCALNVAGRAAFFMLPQFNPVAALTILAAIAFGPEIGFLTGSVTMLLSNMIYGQGAYTPWQMLAMGLVGFLAGLLHRLGLLRRNKLSLSIFGFLVVLVAYGLIMDASSLLIWQGTPTWGALLSYLAAGLPMNLIHGGGTAFFLWFGGEPILEKLDRVRIKYGLRY